MAASRAPRRKPLIFDGPTFFTPGDETAFFNWLQSLPCVGGVKGHLRQLHVEMAKRPNASERREFDALFKRYGIKPLPPKQTAKKPA